MQNNNNQQVHKKNLLAQLLDSVLRIPKNDGRTNNDEADAMEDTLENE